MRWANVWSTQFRSRKNKRKLIPIRKIFLCMWGRGIRFIEMWWMKIHRKHRTALHLSGLSPPATRHERHESVANEIWYIFTANLWRERETALVRILSSHSAIWVAENRLARISCICSYQTKEGYYRVSIKYDYILRKYLHFICHSGACEAVI